MAAIVNISGLTFKLRTSCGESGEIIIGSTNTCDVEINITDCYAGPVDGIPLGQNFYLEFDIVNNSSSDLTIVNITGEGDFETHNWYLVDYPVVPSGESRWCQITVVCGYPNTGTESFTSKVETAECGDYDITWPVIPPTEFP